jgi:hypothetical protein
MPDAARTSVSVLNTSAGARPSVRSTWTGRTAGTVGVVGDPAGLGCESGAPPFVLWIRKPSNWLVSGWIAFT